jgi:hypothetical protein
MEPPIVLCAHEMESAPVEPRDDKGTVVAQRTVDIGGLEPRRPAADAEARSSPVLGLYGEKPPDDAFDGSAGRPGEHLRSQPRRHHLLVAADIDHGRSARSRPSQYSSEPGGSPHRRVLPTLPPLTGGPRSGVTALVAGSYHMSEALPGEHENAVVRANWSPKAPRTYTDLSAAVPGTLTGVVLWPLTLAR